MKLISMTDFVLNQKKELEQVYGNATDALQINKVRIDFIHNSLNYANFLKQTILLKMLVTCDEKGIEIIIDTEHREDNTSWSPDEIKQYKKAESEIYLKTTIDLDTAKFHVKQKRTLEYFTAFDIEIFEYAVKKFELE
jgi:hypothetical protein